MVTKRNTTYTTCSKNRVLWMECLYTSEISRLQMTNVMLNLQHQERRLRVLLRNHQQVLQYNDRNLSLLAHLRGDRMALRPSSSYSFQANMDCQSCILPSSWGRRCDTYDRLMLMPAYMDQPDVRQESLFSAAIAQEYESAEVLMT